MRLWKRSAVWLSGSRPQSSADTAWPATVWVWMMACRSLRAMWMGAVDHEAGAVHLVGRRVEDVAVDVDLDEARGGDLLVEVAIGVDQELVFLARHPHRDVVVDQVGPAVVGDQPIGGGKLDPRLPFLVARALADRRHSRRFDDLHGGSSVLRHDVSRACGEWRVANSE